MTARRFAVVAGPALVLLAACSTSSPHTVASTTTLPGATTFESTGAAPGVPAGVPIPDPRLTPGAVATTDLKLLCQSGSTQRVGSVPQAEKLQVFREYGVDPARSTDYEVDQLVPLELGGSNDIKNLWPEPYAGEFGARAKDRLENRLHDEICGGVLHVAEAQRAIASDWYHTFVATLGAPGTTLATTPPTSR